MSNWHFWRWQWKRGPLRVDIVPSNFNRPLVSYYCDEDIECWSFGWGNGYSDPAFSIELTRHHHG